MLDTTLWDQTSGDLLTIKLFLALWLTFGHLFLAWKGYILYRTYRLFHVIRRFYSFLKFYLLPFSICNQSIAPLWNHLSNYILLRLDRNPFVPCWVNRLWRWHNCCFSTYDNPLWLKILQRLVWVCESSLRWLYSDRWLKLGNLALGILRVKHDNGRADLLNFWVVYLYLLRDWNLFGFVGFLPCFLRWVLIKAILKQFR